MKKFNNYVLNFLLVFLVFLPTVVFAENKVTDKCGTECELYMIFLSVTKTPPQQNKMSISHQTALNEADVKKWAEAEVYILFPAEEGWADHLVFVHKIPKETYAPLVIK